MDLNRRAMIALAGAAAAASPAAWSAPAPEIAAIEAGLGGRVGVAVLNTATGARIVHRADERFPMCSTFKGVTVGAVLRRVDAGREQLDRHISYTAADLLEYAPTTRANVARGWMTVGALCEAAVELSDNTAANLLLASLGGPPAVTAFARSIGDPVTRLDRNEPSLNTAIPGDPRDTTSPSAMLGDLRALVLGKALSDASRATFTGWLVGSQTGGNRLRAGLPAGWRVGDKTGTGEGGATNTIAVLWPPAGGPIIACVYCVGSKAPRPTIEAAHAKIGAIIARSMG